MVADEPSEKAQLSEPAPVSSLNLTNGHRDGIAYAGRLGARLWNRRLANALRELGRHAAANAVENCRAPQALKKGRVRSCRQPLCSFCCQSRKREFAAEWSPAAMAMRWPAFITLTIRNLPNLAGVAPRMTAAFGKLRRQKAFRDACRGGFFCFEVTYSPVTGFHPHIHILADIAADAALAERQLSQAWAKLVLSVRLPLSYEVHILRLDPEHPGHHARARLLYMLKPPCNSTAPTAVSEFYQHWRHKKLVRTFGYLAVRGGRRDT